MFIYFITSGSTRLHTGKVLIDTINIIWISLSLLSFQPSPPMLILHKLPLISKNIWSWRIFSKEYFFKNRIPVKVTWQTNSLAKNSPKFEESWLTLGFLTSSPLSCLWAAANSGPLTWQQGANTASLDAGQHGTATGDSASKVKRGPTDYKLGFLNSFVCYDSLLH